jgi:fumarate hydratase class II
VIALIARETGLPLTEARNHFEAQGARDALVELSGVLRTIAVSLNKISNDIRWMGSGPRTGLTELFLPDLQPGSSIMPGKVNPVLCEAVCQVVAQVVGNDAAVAFAGAAGSLLELNVMMPVAAYNLLQSIAILSTSAVNLAEQAVDGVEATENGPRLVEQGLMTCTALAPRIGYDAAAAIAKEAFRSGRTVREVARERTALSEDELTALLDPVRMTEPG